MDLFTTDEAFTATAPPALVIPVYVGFITLVISIFFYGSFFVPVKKFETGDGMFFQLILCMGIWFTGFVINWARNFPRFYALPMICGVLWTTGNIASVPIIKFIGLALGMLIWGVVSLIVGWANARFGFWGINPQVPNVVWMNYVGVSLAVVSAVIYVFIKPEVLDQKPENLAKVGTIEEAKEASPDTTNPTDTKNPTEEITVLDRISPNLKRILGIIMAVFAGVMYGFNYAPILYVIDRYEGASSNGLDYVLSFYSGLLVTSVLYFLIYCIFKKNKPIIHANVVLPGFLSGCMWGIANCCFLLASSSLSQSVTYPIGASGPPVVASLWGILVFKEIKGLKNFIILGIAFCFTLVGAILSGLSK